MSARSLPLLVVLSCVPVCVPLTGCAVATDLVNPTFLSALGLDPETIVPASGTVVVAFVNDTLLPTRFFAYAVADRQNLTDARNLVVDVEAGQTRFRVLDCPVSLFSPGNIRGGAVEQLAIQVPPGGGADVVESSWEGDMLVEPVDFQCGDVIELRYSTVAPGFLVRVLPGR